MVNENLVRDLKSQLASMENIRSKWEATMDECFDYALPSRATWNEEYEEGRKPRQKLFNTKAVAFLKTAADGFIGYMAPRNLPFFRMTVGDAKMKDRFGVADWLEEVESIIYHHLAKSGFYESLAEFVPDGLGPGTATMYMGEDIARKMIRFSTRHPKETYIGQDEYQNVDMVVRKFKMSIRQIAKAFSGDTVHESVTDRIKRGQLDEKITVAHFTYPREGVEASPLARGTNKKWASYYVDLDNSIIMREGGYEEFPWAVWRYYRNSHETYGRSPTMDALPAIKMGNQMDRTRIDLAQKIVQPPKNIPESMKGEVDLTPDGYNYMPKGEKIEPIVLGGNYPISNDVINRNDSMVADHYHLDFFLMLQRSREQGKQMTATEVMELQGEKAAVLSTIIGSFESSVLSPVVARTAAILARWGALPQPPQALQESGGGIKIEYVGPLAQAQKKYHQSSGIRQALELAMPFAQIDPKSIVVIDAMEGMRQALEGSGMPANIVREKEEVDKILAEAAQAQAQQQQQALQMEMQKNVMPNVDKLNKPAVPGSMLEQMGQALAQKQGQPPQGKK